MLWKLYYRTIRDCTGSFFRSFGDEIRAISCDQGFFIRCFTVLIFFFCFSEEVFSKENLFFKHQTSHAFLKVKSEKDFNEVYKDRIEGLFHNGQKMAEKTSLEHQKEILASFQGRLVEELGRKGMKVESFHRGVVDSDMGKLNHYKNLFLKKSPKSDLLLSFLKGEGKEGSLLKELFSKFPSQKRFLVNPKLSHQKLRDIFNRHPILLHYLHELPGIADPLYFYKKGLLSKEEFKSQLKSNLFHNGPHEGFWKMYSEETLPKKLQGDKELLNFFQNTVFEGKKNSHGFITPFYPGPLSFDGYVHLIFDRLSQGTRAGVDKIFEEIRYFKGDNLVEKMQGLLFSNPLKTIDQLNESLRLVKKDDLLSIQQSLFLENLVKKAKSRLEWHINYVKRNFFFTRGKGGSLLKVKDKEGKDIFFQAKDKLLLIKKGGKETIFKDGESFGNLMKKTVVDSLRSEEEENGVLLESFFSSQKEKLGQ